ncbi:hypothetical protein [Paraburkholderia tropica]|nr:hypothetical protein [Paraburkholderia tropica]
MNSTLIVTPGLADAGSPPARIVVLGESAARTNATPPIECSLSPRHAQFK